MKTRKKINRKVSQEEEMFFLAHRLDNKNWNHLRLPVGALPVLRAKIGLITPTSDFQDSRLLLAAAKKNQK